MSHDTTLQSIAEAEDIGQRADVVLSRHHPQLSRRIAKQLALEGKLRIDGHKAKPSARVKNGQRLELRLPAASEQDRIELEVLKETATLVYVHKPSGVHTVALRPEEPGCLATAVAQAFPETRDAGEDPRESGALHRLDLATSGVVAFAKTRDAWLAARAAFDRREVVKDYLARTHGAWPPVTPEGSLASWLETYEALEPLDDLPPIEPQTMRIRGPLGMGEQRSQMSVRLDGQRATTIVECVQRGSSDALCLRLRLVTGLRHQARVHLAWVGLPIAGDTTYGGAASQRLMLHAYRLDLSAGIEGEQAVIAPPATTFFKT